MNPLTNLDENFQETIWESKVPLRFEMSTCDLVSAKAPMTLYYSLPRIGYLTSIFGNIIKNFEGCISANLSDIWIEYNKTPVRWQYPLGVIVDSLKIDVNSGPILFYVHVRSFPTDEVLKYESLDSLRYYYINSLKEASITKYPQDNKILKLNTTDTNKLKEVVYSNDPKMIKEYRNVMNVISGNGFEKVSRYPVKLIFCQTKICVTKPIAIKEEESKMTMKEYFSKVLGASCEKLKEACDIIVHGVPVEEEMPFLFYYLNFCYMDCFLYICFVEKQK